MVGVVVGVQEHVCLFIAWPGVRSLAAAFVGQLGLSSCLLLHVLASLGMILTTLLVVIFLLLHCNFGYQFGSSLLQLCNGDC